MKTLLASLLVLLVSATAISAQTCTYQGDAIHYNEDWQICAPSEATYIRYVTENVDIYQVTDYFATGEKLLEGTYLEDSFETPVGVFKWYNKEGVVVQRGRFDMFGLKTGFWKEWYDNGILKQKGRYANGVKNGKWVNLYPSGMMESIGIFTKGEMSGIWNWYTPEGKLTHFSEYENGQLVMSSLDKDRTKIKPEFPGGRKALVKYLKENIKYPETARVNNIEGITQVKFSVDADGNILEVNLEKGIYYALDNEAVRVVKEMPQWEPVTSTNIAESVFEYVMPIKFELK